MTSNARAGEEDPVADVKTLPGTEAPGSVDDVDRPGSAAAAATSVALRAVSAAVPAAADRKFGAQERWEGKRREPRWFRCRHENRYRPADFIADLPRHRFRGRTDSINQQRPCSSHENAGAASVGILTSAGIRDVRGARRREGRPGQ